MCSAQFNQPGLLIKYTTWWEGVEDGDAGCQSWARSVEGGGGGWGREGSIEDWPKTKKPCCCSTKKGHSDRSFRTEGGLSKGRVGSFTVSAHRTQWGRGWRVGRRWVGVVVAGGQSAGVTGTEQSATAAILIPAWRQEAGGRRGHPPNLWHTRSHTLCKPKLLLASDTPVTSTDQMSDEWKSWW